MPSMTEIPPVVVSMTTIPSRIQALPRVVDSLLLQNHPVAEIRLYIPWSYRRFPNQSIDIDDIDPRVTVVRVDEDLGPLTKVAFAVEEFKNQGVLVLACDDDMAYEPTWVERFIQEYLKKPQYCLVQSGGFLNQFSTVSQSFCSKPRAKYKGFYYRLRRLLSLGRWKPRSPFVASGFVDIGEGWAGFLVNPDWFDDEFKAIPDQIWLVDDIWISAYLSSRGIGIWLIENALRPLTSEVAQTDALNQIKDPASERNHLNNKAVVLLRERLGVWF